VGGAPDVHAANAVGTRVQVVDPQHLEAPLAGTDSVTESTDFGPQPAPPPNIASETQVNTVCRPIGIKAIRPRATRGWHFGPRPTSTRTAPCARRAAPFAVGEPSNGYVGIHGHREGPHSPSLDEPRCPPVSISAPRTIVCLHVRMLKEGRGASAAEQGIVDAEIVPDDGETPAEEGAAHPLSSDGSEEKAEEAIDVVTSPVAIPVARI